MKCQACNYEHTFSFDDREPESEFIAGKVYFEPIGQPFKKTIFACPKCGTLKIEIAWSE